MILDVLSIIMFPSGQIPKDSATPLNIFPYLSSIAHFCTEPFLHEDLSIPGFILSGQQRYFVLNVLHLLSPRTLLRIGQQFLEKSSFLIGLRVKDRRVGEDTVRDQTLEWKQKPAGT